MCLGPDRDCKRSGPRFHVHLLASGECYKRKGWLRVKQDVTFHKVDTPIWFVEGGVTIREVEDLLDEDRQSVPTVPNKALLVRLSLRVYQGSPPTSCKPFSSYVHYVFSLKTRSLSCRRNGISIECGALLSVGVFPV